MKSKIIIIIFLTLLLIGVAYIKALFSHQDRTGALSQELAGKVPPELMDNYLKKEEAVRSLDSLKLLYTDSLDKITSHWSNMVDSLPDANTDSFQNLIQQLEEKVQEAEKNADLAKQGKKEQFEKMVEAFCKGEMDQLPNDLSKYELEISIREIKGKAQKYFGIPTKSIDRIIAKFR